MRVVVLGAAGKTGREVVSQGSSAGHEVVALTRAASDTISGVTNVVGDATDAGDLTRAFDGADAVISTLGGKSATLIVDSTRAILLAARTTGVKRVVMLSSFAVQRDQLPGPLKLMSSLAMGKMIKDKTAGESQLRSSDLDWTIVYATVLSDGPRTTESHVVPHETKVSAKNKISRADVAGWLLSVAEDDGYRRRDLMITG